MQDSSPGQKDHEAAMTLVIGAMGIVFGDIGTSPLYALRECFTGSMGFNVDKLNVLGAVSLIFWSLILIISIKYILFVLKADNRGEGGILALMTLVTARMDKKERPYFFLASIGLFGAALLYGDGMLTPAISVLSAVEGLNVATHAFENYVVIISIGILLSLFIFQYKGTAKVGKIFGPVILVWFTFLSFVGLRAIASRPEILLALNPYYSLYFFLHNGIHGFAILGTIFLAITGGEALYADLGHFGITPIRKGWFYIALPSLVLNYLGQGAYLLAHPKDIENLFYRLVPHSCLYPSVLLATLSTVIASQAVISGAFSLTRQAIQLGLFPRLEIIHTSNNTIGQVYIPVINTLLLAGTLLLITLFKYSGNLASAYGIAVSATMLITTILMIFAARILWNMDGRNVFAIGIFFLSIEVLFFFSNLMKFFSGGYIPVIIAALVYMIMLIWRDGRNLLRKNLESQVISTDLFLRDVQINNPRRVRGVAVFLSGNPKGIPRTLLHNFKHNKILHNYVVLLSVRTEEVPRVPSYERIESEKLGEGFYRAIVKYGFSENPDIPSILQWIEDGELKFFPMETTFFLGRETLLIGPSSNMSRLRKKIFSFLSHNAFDATRFFKIPPNSVIELGIQIPL